VALRQPDSRTWSTVSIVPLSGAQFEISAGPYQAVAVGSGGGIRALRHDGRELIDGYAEDAMADGARGQVLAPWPNRLRDGRWCHDGQWQQLPVDDVTLRHANHGLVRWATWTPELHTASRVVLRHRLHPRPGYPFVLDIVAEYSVDHVHGLDVRLTAQNRGAQAAPVALGMHPYLAAPDGGRIDDCILQVPARRVLLLDERRITNGSACVDGTAYDLRPGRLLGDLVLDVALTELEPDEQGRIQVSLTAPSGRRTELWASGAVRWLQVFTGDTLRPDRRRQGVAVEPMTAPANALSSGDGLVLLPPGEVLSLRWGVVDRAVDAPRR
jgi:aldose 1-epimerase